MCHRCGEHVDVNSASFGAAPQGFEIICDGCLENEVGVQSKSGDQLAAAWEKLTR